VISAIACQSNHIQITVKWVTHLNAVHAGGAFSTSFLQPSSPDKQQKLILLLVPWQDGNLDGENVRQMQ